MSQEAAFGGERHARPPISWRGRVRPSVRPGYVFLGPARVHGDLSRENRRRVFGRQRDWGERMLSMIMIINTEVERPGPGCSEWPVSSHDHTLPHFSPSVKGRCLFIVAMWMMGTATINGDLDRPLPFGVSCTFGNARRPHELMICSTSRPGCGFKDRSTTQLTTPLRLSPHALRFNSPRFQQHY